MGRTKMDYVSTLLVLSTAVFLGGVRGTDCPDYWTSFEGSCYLFPDHHQMNFKEAERFCNASYSSHLVHINSPAENAFIKTYLKKMKDEPHWMDLTDMYNEGKYMWNDTGSLVEFSDWAPGQPDNWIGGDEDCILFFDDDDYKWHDAPCGHDHEPICELSSEDFGIDNLEIIG